MTNKRYEQTRRPRNASGGIDTSRAFLLTAELFSVLIKILHVEQMFATA